MKSILTVLLTLPLLFGCAKEISGEKSKHYDAVFQKQDVTVAFFRSAPTPSETPTWNIELEVPRPLAEDTRYEVRWGVGITPDWDMRDEVVLPAGQTKVTHDSQLFFLEEHPKIVYFETYRK